jgi:outer membrane murein-binding lipoprotein Lpp
MSPSEIQRQKYAALMAQVEALEEAIGDLENDITAARELPGSEDVAALAEQLQAARQQLAEKRAELARVSDGCGRPHPQ